MSTTTRKANRSARIEARIAPDALALVRRAAEIQGRSVSEFVTYAAEAAAREAVAREQVIHLSPDAQKTFVELLLNPPEPNAALKRAVARHRRLFGPL